MIASKAPLYNDHQLFVSDRIMTRFPTKILLTLLKQKANKQSDPESQPDPVPT